MNVTELIDQTDAGIKHYVHLAIISYLHLPTRNIKITSDHQAFSQLYYTSKTYNYYQYLYVGIINFLRY